MRAASAFVLSQAEMHASESQAEIQVSHGAHSGLSVQLFMLALHCKSPQAVQASPTGVIIGVPPAPPSPPVATPPAPLMVMVAVPAVVVPAVAEPPPPLPPLPPAGAPASPPPLGVTGAESSSPPQATAVTPSATKTKLIQRKPVACERRDSL